MYPLYILIVNFRFYSIDILNSRSCTLIKKKCKYYSSYSLKQILFHIPLTFKFFYILYFIYFLYTLYIIFYIFRFENWLTVYYIFIHSIYSCWKLTDSILNFYSFFIVMLKSDWQYIEFLLWDLFLCTCILFNI